MLFDISEQERIGFAESDCDYNDLVMVEKLDELEDIMEELDVDEEEKEIIEKLIDEIEEEIEEEESVNKDKKSGSDMTQESSGIPFEDDKYGLKRCDSDSCKYGFVFGVFAVGTVFFIAYKKKQRRDQIKEYEIQNTDDDDDFHMETQIQMTSV